MTIADWAIRRPIPTTPPISSPRVQFRRLPECWPWNWRRRNRAVRVNCILPGPVMFPADLPEEERRASIAGTLVHREGRPEHVGQAVLCCIDNDFMTGASLMVDGGRAIAGGEAEWRE